MRDVRRRNEYEITTKNLTRLILRETGKASEDRIDGQTLRVKPAPELAFENTGSGWKSAPAKRTGLHKTHACRVRSTTRFSIRFCWCAPPARRGTRREPAGAKPRALRPAYARYTAPTRA